MKLKDILSSTNHRPWAIPNKNWMYYQEWNNAIFLHWKVDIEILRNFVPSNLEIDTFEENAWVSLVAFTMEKIRPRNLPAYSPISNFDEINIRTYIKSGQKTGVYFLSIEGSKRLSCLIAKSLSQLPYRYSHITRESGSYISKNKVFNDTLEIKFLIGTEITKKESIDLWLTERYALFQNSGNQINEFEIQHIEWPCNKIYIDKLNLNYERFKTLITNNPDKVHYSKGVQVLAWDKTIIDK